MSRRWRHVRLAVADLRGGREGRCIGKRSTREHMQCLQYPVAAEHIFDADTHAVCRSAREDKAVDADAR